MNTSRLFAGLLLAALAPAALVACGGDDTDPSTSGTGGGTGAGTGGGSSTSTGGGTDFDFAKYCEDADAKSVECGNPANPDSVAECKALQSCAEGGYKPKALERLLTCFLELPCDGGSDDACYESASNEVPNETFDAYVAACTAKRTECAEGVKESLCGPTINVLKDEIVEAATLCFDKACAEVSDCIVAAIAPVEDCFE